MQNLARKPGAIQLLRWLGLQWPAYCFVCSSRSAHGLDLCAACLAHFPGLICRDVVQSAGEFAFRQGEFRAPTCGYSTLCVQCGHCWPGSEPRHVCPLCASRTSPFARIVVPFRYAWPVDRLIHQLKYQQRRNHARVLGVLLARQATVSAPRLPDMLLPVPMHSARLRERGFNQAADIARWCGRELNVRVQKNRASRILDTGALVGLSRAEREHRIRGAFTVSERVAGQRIAIVDDVLTTGATASELARELYDTGAAEVELWVIARTAAEP